jgi:hypothetical protein
VVPPRDVVALEEMLVVVLVLDSTVALELAVDDGESAEVGLNIDAVVLWFREASAEVAAAGDDTADDAADAVSSAFPPLADPPAPAPDDDPAVFDAAGVPAAPAGEA